MTDVVSRIEGGSLGQKYQDVLKARLSSRKLYTAGQIPWYISHKLRRDVVETLNCEAEMRGRACVSLQPRMNLHCISIVHSRNKAHNTVNL